MKISTGLSSKQIIYFEQMKNGITANISDNYTYLPAKLQDNEILWKSMIVRVIELKIP